MRHIRIICLAATTVAFVLVALSMAHGMTSWVQMTDVTMDAETGQLVQSGSEPVTPIQILLQDSWTHTIGSAALLLFLTGLVTAAMCRSYWAIGIIGASAIVAATIFQPLLTYPLTDGLIGIALCSVLSALGTSFLSHRQIIAAKRTPDTPGELAKRAPASSASDALR